MLTANNHTLTEEDYDYLDKLPDGWGTLIVKDNDDQLDHLAIRRQRDHHPHTVIYYRDLSMKTLDMERYTMANHSFVASFGSSGLKS